MEQMIRAILQAKGVQAPEEDYPILTAQWESILAMKQQATKAKLGDFDIALCHTLKGASEVKDENIRNSEKNEENINSLREMKFL